MAVDAARVHYLGIRHHGPGSARRLVQVLDALDPAAVLVEGPADATPLLPRLADPAMRPPVALLAHTSPPSASRRPTEPDGERLAVFTPFAEFSPEYQAICWAVRRGVPVSFIDLPAAVATDDEPGDEPGGVRRDPIGAIAAAAGYTDGESWWNDWVETGGDQIDSARRVFDAVAEIMRELRAAYPADPPVEQRREAHMRLAVAKALQESDPAPGEVARPVAVVCGAWHVPALERLHAKGYRRSADRALVTGLPRRPVALTWVPWTSPRLAASSGYAAGVAAPRWYAHLWRHGAGAGEGAGEGDGPLTRWLVDVAGILRAARIDVWPASVIEAVRLAGSLAQVRERPRPGFEEARDAVVACLCGGDDLLWRRHAPAILLGHEVGEVPADLPLMPLLADLQRWQRTLRLKPEALPRELALDLRSEAGSARSTLLHRLDLLDVPWGVLDDPGGSRGTFRERWVIAWEPELAVRLADVLVYGTTIEQAAAGRTLARLREDPALTRLAALVGVVQECLQAQLPQVADAALAALDEQAAHAQDCREMLEAVPPLVQVQRYGTARRMELDRLGALVRRLLLRAAVGLPYAARHLDADEAAALAGAVQGVHQVLGLAELGDDDTRRWWYALAETLAADAAAPRVRGLVARLLHDGDRLPEAELHPLLARMLAGEATDGAGFFEGFFAGAAHRLIHDDALRTIIDGWLSGLDGEVFTTHLPVLRRVFADLDAVQRRRLIETLLRPDRVAAQGVSVDEALLPRWREHERVLDALLEGRVPAWPS